MGLDSHAHSKQIRSSVYDVLTSLLLELLRHEGVSKKATSKLPPECLVLQIATRLSSGQPQSRSGPVSQGKQKHGHGSCSCPSCY